MSATKKSLQERAEAIEILWRDSVPCEPPDSTQFALWARSFTDAQIQRAFRRTGNKILRRQFIHHRVPTIHRFVTGLLVNLRNEQAAAEASSNNTTLTAA